ncbi:acetate--CoA ligase family protein [Schnuerera ultunensis]|uniref:Acetyl-CoA synthetase (ADP-forming) alpha and beta subunits n=1 Tax=[Clostridium] ultunense Esp TaxID=1288971 RepID=A0A1M4PQA1_9FIRM|nr:acetate--CoA ligase family protein [Schnuerera ultunensis]SHD77666.1 Acetyl-CoA synthetase (ADP-forming) alpha and beta subunits [[Clostridium] ultunense Esp]
MNISNLLQPKKIAVIGASERGGSFGGDTCRNIMDFSNPSKYYFVNPKRTEIFGQKCYNSTDEIPTNFDMVIICTPQSSVIDILKQSKEKGCKAAVVYASGYSETGTVEGKIAEKELIETCIQLDIALLGPNCGGFINYIDNVYSFAFISEKRDRKGNVGLISQSGQLCLSLMDNPKGKFSYVISAGNSSVITMEEYLNYLVEDQNTKVVAVYLEGVSKPGIFVEALKKAAIKKKPIVVLKTGRSEKGSQISASHTGSLSGSDKTYDAIFKKFGVIRVNDMEELLSTAHLLATIKEYPKKARLASMNLSGGETIITADMAYSKGLNFPDFTKETLNKLNQMLPSYATPNNPLDMTATLSYDSKKYAKALKTVMDDPNIDMVLIGYTLLLNIADPCIYYMTEGIEKVVKEGNTKPMAMIPYIENTRNPEYTERLEKAGVPILPPVVYAMEILKKFSDFVEYNSENHTLELALPKNTRLKTKKFLSEHESKTMLAKAGIPVPKEQIAKTKEEAYEIAKETGYPLVMKIESADIPHKSDVGGVKLNIKSEKELGQAFDEIMNNVVKNAPEAKINGILVQEMLSKGLELIVGVNNDPIYGPMVLCGLGGVFVEIFKDVALYPAPLNHIEAMNMIKSLKAYPLLTGYRSSEELDIEALTDLIVKVSDFAVKNKDKVVEVDINPVFLYEKGKKLSVADALILIQE